ncbi:MAG TPA: hydroxyethylthiazole kinase, partial [Ruminococcaceae bacterium]|nr:hydroxyethylthiazole kinase [Oscillospiraceae bacterium]
VDAASGIDETIAAAKALNHKTNAVIAVTGKTDIITDGKKVFAIHNGCPLMKKITGAGCMLTAVAAAFCAANKNDVLNSAAAAVGAFGLSGELAYKMLDGKGDMTGSYKIHLIDCMSIMTGEILRGGLKIEHR